MLSALSYLLTFPPSSLLSFPPSVIRPLSSAFWFRQRNFRNQHADHGKNREYENPPQTADCHLRNSNLASAG